MEENSEISIKLEYTQSFEKMKNDLEFLAIAEQGMDDYLTQITK